MATRVSMAEMSRVLIRITPRLSWMDGVKAAVRSKRMTMHDR